MADDTLYIGDVICLYSAESYGFVFSSQSSSVHNWIAVGSKQDKRKPDVKDQNLLSFEICVANRYKLNKQSRELKSKIEEHPDDYTLRTRYHQAKNAAKAESEDNELEQKRQQGKKLLYGQVVQLKHRFTRKYIHVSTAATSPTEGKNMAIVLLPYNAKNAQFKVMPRYKVKAEGDVVQEGDQIVFESVKSAGHYVHVSKATFGNQSVYQRSHELNLSVQQSGFTIFRKYKPTPDDNKKVKIGNIVRFYHKEMEAYLVAEGLFDFEVTEDVHLRCRPVVQTNPKSMIPSTSAVTYWQIELQEGCVAGGVFQFGQQCKLLHMCTRRYLSVESYENARGDSNKDKFKVNLTSDHLDPKTVFRLHPVDRDSDDIIDGSYCRIENVVSGQWLHASTDEYIRNQVKALNKESKSMGSLKWSTAVMKKITVAEEQQYDDAFTIQTVSPPLENIFSFMAGMVPFLQKLVHDKNAGVILNKKMSHDAVTGLEEIRQFMVVEGEPIKDRQKLMRNLRIVELLVNLLKCNFDAPERVYKVNIFRVVYNVLHEYLRGRSRKNKLYIARYIDFFRTQFGSNEAGLNAVHMVMESIRDNRKIVDLITEEHIDAFVELLLVEKNYRYLDLLSVLCVCAGVSISNNQNYITKAWLITFKQLCVFQTKMAIKGSGGKTVCVTTDNGKTWIDLVTFSKRNKDSDEYLFFERQLKLFGYLAKGQNENSISVITNEYLTWEELFMCLCNENFPEQLRALCCDLIITLFVDRGGNRSVLDRVKLCYVFDDVSSDDEPEILASNSQSETYKYFPHLSHWIADFLSRNTEMTASNIGNNILIKQVLRLVYYLVSFGFYGKYEDIKRLLDPLMLLLDGRHDKPYPNIEGKEAMEVMFSFRQKDRFKPSPETKAIVEAKIQALEVLDLFFNFRFNNRLEKFIFMFKIAHEQMNRPGGVSEFAPLMNEGFELEKYTGLAKRAKKKMVDIFDATAFMRQYNIVEILIDLSHYEYSDIVRKSMHLLNRWFSAYQNLFKRAVLTQVLITDESVKVYRRVEELLPELRRLAAYRMGNEEAEQVVTILQEIIRFCHLPDAEEEPHPVNQTILFNSGILEIMFNFLSKEIDVKILDHYAGLLKVFECSFVMLKLLASSNHVIQQRLYDRLELILSKKGGFVQMAELVAEIFIGNTHTSMKITEHQMHQIMALVVRHRIEVPQFIGVLKSVMKIEESDMSLKRNQVMVMTTFMQYNTELAIKEDENERMKLLLSDNTKELEFFISVVDLLATCAEGENRFIESICQTIFKIPEIFKVLNHPTISDNLRRPYLTFLIGSYMHTVSGMIESGAGDIPHDPITWEYLTNVSATLVKVTGYTKKSRQQVKSLLKKRPANGACNGNEVEDMSGSLHYLFDGVMPFLQVFCTSYYEVDKEHYPNEPIQLKILAENFKTFFEEIEPLVTNEKHLQKMITCMGLLFSTNVLSTEDMNLFQEKYGHGMASHDVRSDAKKNYDECYSGEEDISEQLSVFAVNMSAAYGGVNDVQTQIGFPSKRAYSEIGGDEMLPLSEEFQNHINVFIDYNAKSPLQKYKLSEKLVLQLSRDTLNLKLTGVAAHNLKNIMPCQLSKMNEKERLEQLELDLKCMQLLRGMVHNEIVKLPENFEHEPQSSKKQLKMIEDVQNALNHYGSIAGTLEHLAHANDDIVRELLAFLVALLFNSNAAVQSTLHEYFLSAKDETFVLAIKNRINLSIIATREKRVLQALRQSKIEETVAQARALKKAMKNGSLANLAVSSLSRNLKASMASMKQSFSSLPRSQGSSVHLKTGHEVKMNGHRHTMGVPGHTRVPNGLSDTKMSNTQPPAKWVSPSKVAPVANGIHAGITVDVAVSKLNIQDDNKENGQEIEDEFEEMLNGEMPAFELKDDGCIELVLRLLGRMCDSQHQGLQNYIREQSTNIKSINLAAETINFLNIMYTNINAGSIVLITEIFETLVEFTSGNFTNQAFVFDYKICDYINHILRANVFKDCTDWQVYSLKHAIGNLVRCLTEENFSEDDDVKAKLAKEVMEFLDTAVLVNVMKDARKLHIIHSTILARLCKEISEFANQRYKMEEDFTTLLQKVGYQYYHLLTRKLDLYPDMERDSMVKTAEERAALDFYAENTMSIEIVKNGVLQKMYFQVRDKGVLREEIKEKFKYEVDRSSPSNRIRDFMEWVRDIIKDIKYQRKVRSNPIGKFLVNAWSPLNYAVMLVTFAICALIMVTWEAGSSDSPKYNPSFTHAVAEILLYVLGGIHNLLSLAIFLSFVISNRPKLPPLIDYINSWRGKTEKEENFKCWLQTTKDSHLEVKAFGKHPIYYFLFLGFSIAGTCTEGYFFAFHMLHIAEMNLLLKGVTRAITTNGKALLMVTILGLVILYIYALVLFGFYREWMWLANQGRHCQTVYECFVSILHHGLAGEPYSTFHGLMGDNFGEAIGITVFDVSFFVIITVIGLNIVLGIIVDTFSQLRDAKFAIETDMHSMCFICIRESYEFETKGGGEGFRRHVKLEHNLWAYLFFFIHLDETRPNNYSALEFYVYKLLLAKNFDFFPLGRALSLENEEDSKDIKLDQLQAQVNFVVAKLKEQEMEMMKEKEKQKQREWEKTYKKRKA